MTTRTPTIRRRRAFTLIELVAVMVVLAILGAVALPKYFDISDNARSAARGACGNLKTAIENWRMNDAVVNGGSGSYPPTLDEVLETQDGNKLLNPYWDPRIPVYNIDHGGAAKMFMINKTIEVAVQNNWGSIWYNPDNGRVAFRVAEQATDQETLDLFNYVNECSVSSLSQTTP